MKGGNVQEFVDTLSLGLEKEFSFRGKKLFAQGWAEDGAYTLTLDQWEPSREGHVWSYKSTSWDECWEAFVNAPVFDGLTFWEAEGEIEWLYG